MEIITLDVEKTTNLKVQCVCKVQLNSAERCVFLHVYRFGSCHLIPVAQIKLNLIQQ